MRLKTLKKILDKLSPEELEQELLYNSDEYGLSGVVTNIKKARADLYWTGDDDPSRLYTKRQLMDDCGMDKDEIDGCQLEIPKGAYVLKF